MWTSSAGSQQVVPSCHSQFERGRNILLVEQLAANLLAGLTTVLTCADCNLYVGIMRCRERGARALEERLGLKSTVAVSKEAAGPPADIETGLSGGNGDTPAASTEAAAAAPAVPASALDTA